MIWIKVYETQGEVLLAACDDDILGKTFEEGELQLSVSEKFFGGERVSRRIFKNRLREATIANLIGKNVVDIALDMGMVNSECILEVQGIPHAQVARI
jgi:hypothetical protein